MKRLDILLHGNVISQDQYRLLQRVIGRIGNWQTDDQERFITHLAMAVVRVANKQQVTPTSKVVKNQVQKSPFYNQATRFLSLLFRSEKIAFSDEECIYLCIHIINVLKKAV